MGRAPESYLDFLDKEGLQGARIGVLRESMSFSSEPDSEDFKKVTEIGLVQFTGQLTKAICVFRRKAGLNGF